MQGGHDASLTALNQLHAALTPPQRAKLVDELQGHWEKWKEAQGQDEADDKQHHAGHMLALVRELGLTQDQADKIKASFKDKMKAAPQDHAHKEVQDHLTAFGTAFKADTFDAKKVTGAKAADGHMAQVGRHAARALPRGRGADAHARAANEAGPDDPRPRGEVGRVGASVRRELSRERAWPSRGPSADTRG